MKMVGYGIYFIFKEYVFITKIFRNIYMVDWTSVWINSVGQKFTYTNQNWWWCCLYLALFLIFSLVETANKLHVYFLWDYCPFLQQDCNNSVIFAGFLGRIPCLGSAHMVSTGIWSRHVTTPPQSPFA